MFDREMYEERLSRYFKILHLWGKGQCLSYAKIGEIFGISRQRVQIIIKQGIPYPPGYPLSFRKTKCSECDNFAVFSKSLCPYHIAEEYGVSTNV